MADAPVNKKDLLEESKADLAERAKKLELPGRSKMSKEELAAAIASALIRTRSARERRARSSEDEETAEVKSRKTLAASRERREALEKRVKRKKEGKETKMAAKTKKTKEKAAASVPGVEQLALGKSGSSSSIRSSAAPTPRRAITEDMVAGRPLPKRYGRDKLVILARDPRWLFAYWEITPELERKIYDLAGADAESGTMILRLYDIENGKVIASFDVQIHPGARSWYVHLPVAGREWKSELGLVGRSGRFYRILGSAVVASPSDKVSTVIDEQYATLDEDFDEIFRLSGGEKIRENLSARAHGGSAVVQRRAPQKGKPEQWDWPIPVPGGASGGMSSFGSFRAAPPKAKGKDDFFFWVDCELILYGGTQPDATVTVQGRKIRLRPDGTFTLRYALPDGKVDLPVKAVRADGKRKREARPIVTRVTK